MEKIVSNLNIILDFLFTAISNGILLAFLYKKLEPKTRFIYMLLAMTIIRMGIRYVLTYKFGINDNYSLIIYNTILFIYIIAAFKGKTLEKLFWVTIVECLMLILKNLNTTIGKMLVFDTFVGYESYLIAEQMTVAAVIMCNLVSLIVIAIPLYIMSDKDGRRGSGLSTSVLILLISVNIVVSTCMIGAQELGFTLLSVNPDIYLGFLALELLIITLSMLVLMSIYSFYQSMIQQSKANIRNYISIQKAELDQIHYNKMKELYNSTRAWRHDYRNHIQVIRGFAEAGNTEALEAYIKEMDEKQLDFSWQDEDEK
ncbi:MAG: Spo0B domain-containing protein [Suipraeoptans sp.]